VRSQWHTDQCPVECIVENEIVTAPELFRRGKKRDFAGKPERGVGVPDLKKKHKATQQRATDAGRCSEHPKRQDSRNAAQRVKEHQRDFNRDQVEQRPCCQQQGESKPRPR